MNYRGRRNIFLEAAQFRYPAWFRNVHTVVWMSAQQICHEPCAGNKIVVLYFKWRQRRSKHFWKIKKERKKSKSIPNDWNAFPIGIERFSAGSAPSNKVLICSREMAAVSTRQRFCEGKKKQKKTRQSLPSHSGNDKKERNDDHHIARRVHLLLRGLACSFHTRQKSSADPSSAALARFLFLWFHGGVRRTAWLRTRHDANVLWTTNIIHLLNRLLVLEQRQKKREKEKKRRKLFSRGHLSKKSRFCETWRGTSVFWHAMKKQPLANSCRHRRE